MLATQNPIELEGTYPLPEAQLDRFLFKLEVTRNDVATLRAHRLPPRTRHRAGGRAGHDAAETFDELLELVRRIYLPESWPTTSPAWSMPPTPANPPPPRGIRYGASPRAALALASGAKARALMHERTNASFEDVKAVAPAVLRHRIVLDYNARVEGRTTNDIIRAARGSPLPGHTPPRQPSPPAKADLNRHAPPSLRARSSRSRSPPRK